MNSKKEVAETLKEVLVKRNFTMRKIAIMADISDTNIARFLKHHKGMSFDALLKTLDALDLKIVLEDANANWGDAMSRLRIMPKKLYVGQRIEARDIIRENGFDPRVDLFDNPEHVLKFMPENCDIYEIRPGGLFRRKFDVIDHPFGTMYSYNDWISPELILNRVTHK